MRKLFVVLFSFTALSVSAALPPTHQNPKDLKVLTDYIYSNSEVVSGLRAINFEDKSIEFHTYERGLCIASFERENLGNPSGWVGLKSPLIYTKTECERSN